VSTVILNLFLPTEASSSTQQVSDQDRQHPTYMNKKTRHQDAQQNENEN
jgi:hypothetical protein